MCESLGLDVKGQECKVYHSTRSTVEHKKEHYLIQHKFFVSVMFTACVPVRYEMNVYVLFRRPSLAVLKGMYEKFSVSRQGWIKLIWFIDSIRDIQTGIGSN